MTNILAYEDLLYVEWFGSERGHCHRDGNIDNAPRQHCHEQMIRANVFLAAVYKKTENCLDKKLPPIFT